MNIKTNQIFHTVRNIECASMIVKKIIWYYLKYNKNVEVLIFSLKKLIVFLLEIKSLINIEYQIRLLIRSNKSYNKWLSKEIKSDDKKNC